MSAHIRFRSVVDPELAGTIGLPEGEVRDWGLLVHGFTLGKDSPAASRVRDCSPIDLECGVIESGWWAG